MIDRRNNLDDINDKIRKEQDEEKRSTLLILHGLVTSLSSNTKILEELKKSLDQQESRLDEHEVVVIEGKTAWKMITGVFGLLHGGFFAAALYGYVTVANLRDDVINLKSSMGDISNAAIEIKKTIHDQDVYLPEIRSRLDIAKRTEKTIHEMQDTIESMDMEISSIRYDVSTLFKKRVIKGSK